ncbi:hypothetical protein CDAR_253201 [Caerostris darwini]|uniref:Uncharacterized protein n=1 Tax=Caerostris darwini TaxID=1538125 RepID=A0AAV4SLB3_9ARAC|nr:hypothetical protein CDAR_253201 [Caerostris darwini]
MADLTSPRAHYKKACTVFTFLSEQLYSVIITGLSFSQNYPPVHIWDLALQTPPSRTVNGLSNNKLSSYIILSFSSLLFCFEKNYFSSETKITFHQISV